MSQTTNINIDNMGIFAPVIAASLVNAFYSALLLKKECGKEVTIDLREKTIEEVVTLWLMLQRSVVKQFSNQPVEKEEK
jgi:hypothetical protein